MPWYGIVYCSMLGDNFVSDVMMSLCDRYLLVHYYSHVYFDRKQKLDATTLLIDDIVNEEEADGLKTYYESNRTNEEQNLPLIEDSRKTAS